jgi:hypothetical protein
MRTKLIPTFTMKALCNDEATGKFFFKIAFRNVDGNIATLEIARSKIDKKSLIEALKDAGAFFHDDAKQNEEAIQALIASQSTAKRVTFAKATGWRQGDRLFVTPDNVFGANDGPAQIVPPRVKAQHLRSRRKGSLAGWQEHVAEPAKMSSRLGFAICLALAAPLLRYTRLHSFGVLVAGASKSGKSTMQIAGGSVMGPSNEDQLPSFDITDAGFNELLTGANDLFIPWNELGLSGGSDAERDARLRKTAYVIAQGGGTTYSTRAHMPKSGEVSERRCIVLASGEESLDALAQKAGRTREPGSTIRFIDLPATRKGATDIFDLAPESTKSQKGGWVQDTCMRIRDGAEAHHGIALTVLVKKVIRQRSKIERRLRCLRQRFVDKVAANHGDQIIRHMALLFGHIYAAGILGVKFKILPWSEQFVMTAVKRCWLAALRSLRLEAALTAKAITRLKRKARGRGVMPASSRMAAERFRDADGFYRCHKGERQLVVRGERFKDWFSDPRQPLLLLRRLNELGALVCSKDGQRPGSSIVWAESQVDWPDGTRPRSIVIRVDKLQ